MYLALRLFRTQSAEEIYEEEKKKEEKERKMSGLLAYAIPFFHEYTVFPMEDIPRLKAYIRSSTRLGDVLRKAGRKGFPLYFQLFESPFTSGEICGILKNDAERTMAEKPIIHCFHYDQVVHLALCVSRNLIYPKESSPSPYYLEVKEKLRAARDRQEKKKLRRELKKHDPVFDPYPKCRSCVMAKKLIQDSCLGVELDVEDKECLECPSKRECCQLMRLRIEKILEGAEDEVAGEIIEEWKELNKRRKEVKQEMAKKKKKPEDVTEEVVEEKESRSKRRSEGGDKTKAEKRAERREARKKRKEEDEGEAPKRKKKGKRVKGKGEEVSSTIKKLLRDLQDAKDDKDQDAARKIRVKLREEGYSLRAHQQSSE